jgi:hypothetical protein
MTQYCLSQNHWIDVSYHDFNGFPIINWYKKPLEADVNDDNGCQLFQDWYRDYRAYQLRLFFVSGFLLCADICARMYNVPTLSLSWAYSLCLACHFFLQERIKDFEYCSLSHAQGCDPWPNTLIFIMIDFFFPLEKTRDSIPDLKCTGSVFVLSVSYKCNFIFMLKKGNHYENESTVPISWAYSLCRSFFTLVNFLRKRIKDFEYYLELRVSYVRFDTHVFVIRVCVRMYKHTYSTYVQTYIQIRDSYVHTYIHTDSWFESMYVCTYIHTYFHTYIQRFIVYARVVDVWFSLTALLKTANDEKSSTELTRNMAPGRCTCGVHVWVSVCVCVCKHACM